MVAGIERENAMKVITDVSFYKLIQGLSDGEDYIEDSGDLYGDHFNTINGMIDYVVEYAFGDLYSDRYKTGITKMANDPRYSNCIDIRSGEDVEIGDDGMKHVEVDISSCSGDRIEMVPFSSELSKYTWSVSIAYSEDEVEGAENVHESRRLRGRSLRESRISRVRRGRMLREKRITIDLDENKIFAVKGYPDYPENDDCAYDEILVQKGGSKFEPGSGHNGKECAKYASFANRLVDEYDDEHDDIEEELEEYVCKGLNEKFGGNWIVGSINGSSQGDSFTIIYNTETNTDKQIEYFKNDFFGFGYDYTCYNGLGEYEVNVFVNDLDEDETLSIIADACSVDEANVEIVDKKPDFDFIRKHEVKESCRPRGRMLKEDGRKRTVIFKQYRDISYVDIGFVDEEVALEAVKKLNDAMRFIKKNGGEIDGSFGLSDWD